MVSFTGLASSLAGLLGFSRVGLLGLSGMLALSSSSESGGTMAKAGAGVVGRGGFVVGLAAGVLSLNQVAGVLFRVDLADGPMAPITLLLI